MCRLNPRISVSESKDSFREVLVTVENNFIDDFVLDGEWLEGGSFKKINDIKMGSETVYRALVLSELLKTKLENHFIKFHSY